MKRVIWLALFVCMVLSLWGKIRLPSILGDNMVLQRSDTVNLGLGCALSKCDGETFLG